jgi:hypothetical protein
LVHTLLQLPPYPVDFRRRLYNSLRLIAPSIVPIVMTINRLLVLFGPSPPLCLLALTGVRINLQAIPGEMRSGEQDPNHQNGIDNEGDHNPVHSPHQDNTSFCVGESNNRKSPAYCESLRENNRA